MPYDENTSEMIEKNKFETFIQFYSHIKITHHNNMIDRCSKNIYQDPNVI